MRASLVPLAVLSLFGHVLCLENVPPPTAKESNYHYKTEYFNQRVNKLTLIIFFTYTNFAIL